MSQISLAEVVVEADHLWCSHGWRWIIRDVSFQVLKGEIAVLVGVNGVGKTTLLSNIAGAVSPARGSVRVFNNPRRCSVESERAARRRTVFLPDQAWLPGSMLVREYLGSVSELFGIPAATAVDRIDALLELFGLTDAGSQLLWNLSTGQKKKVGLCTALLPDRDLLLLDEPFSGGLDPAGISALRRVLQHRARNIGQTIILTTPVAEVVAELADRLLILRDGTLAENLTREELAFRLRGSQSSFEGINSLIFPDVDDRVTAFLHSTNSQHPQA